MLETQVLIVGAGPVGQMAALLLARQGVSSIIVDRRLERMTAPKAHAVNSRTLEICEAAGLSAESVRATGAPADKAGWVRFVSTLTGTQFGNLPYERQQDDVKDLTPYPLTNIAQPDFEALLERQLADCDLVTLLRGADCTSVQQTQSEAVTSITLHDGQDQIIKSHYVLAADGANSRLRSALGIALEGPADLQHNMMIHFEADLRPFVKDKPGILYFLFEPDAQGALIAYDLGKTWVLMHAFDPATTSPDVFDDATCIALVEKAVGKPLSDIEIKNVGPWSMCAQVAERYGQGRVFLIGDAAHRFPPTGGLGLNTGIGDAQNIAWKIAAVENGWADPRLLDTYEDERRPVAQVNTEQSLENSAKLFELFAALYGPDPEQTRSHFDAISKAPTQSTDLADAIEAQRPHFDSLNLQLGYRYRSSAVKTPATIMNTEPLNIRHYIPSNQAGASAPHRWVCHDGQEVSLLSLLPMDRFTLLAGPDGGKWMDVLASVDVPIKLLIDTVDFDFKETWAKVTCFSNQGAFLIRPDRHIAHRYKTICTAAELSDDLAILLSNAQGEVLNGARA